MNGADQLRLPAAGTQNLKLFSDHFLRDRLPELPEYQEPDHGEVFDRLRGLWQAESPALTGYVTVRTRAEAEWLRAVAEWCGTEAERLESELAGAAG